MKSSDEWWGEDIVPRIRWMIELPDGSEIPHRYGIAYYRGFEMARTRMVCMPLPINLIAGFFRSVYWHLRCPPWRFTEYRVGLSMRRKAELFNEGADAMADVARRWTPDMNQPLVGNLREALWNPYGRWNR